MQNKLAQLRATELTQLKNNIDKAQSCVVYGMPGVGVSSFLRLTENVLDSQGVQVVNLDLNLFSSYSLQGFIEMLFASIRANFEQSGLSFKYKTLDEFIFDKKQPLDKLVIQIDRFEKALQFMQSDFFDFLRAVRDNSPVQILYVIGIDRDFNYYGTFLEQDEFYSVIQTCEIYIQPFDEQNAVTYILDKADGQVDELVAREIYAFTGGHLRYINLCLSLISGENTNVAQVIAENLSKFSYHSARIYTSLSPVEQNTVKLVAQNETGLQNTQSFKTLQKIGIVGVDGAIFSKVFADFVMDQTIPQEKGIYYDADLNRFYKNKKRLDTELTVSEFKALQVLYENKGSIVDRNELAEQVWGAKVNEGVSDEAIDQLIKRLREKVEDNAGNPVFIVTVRDRGFVFET